MGKYSKYHLRPVFVRWYINQSTKREAKGLGSYAPFSVQEEEISHIFAVVKLGEQQEYGHVPNRHVSFKVFHFLE